jgi:uncharacterized protein YkwD
MATVHPGGILHTGVLPSRLRIVAGTAVLGLALALAAAASPAHADVALSTVRAQILSETNGIRAGVGAAALREASALDAVAQAWSQKQAAAQAMSHNPSMSTQIPSGWTKAGENVAYGYEYTAVTTAWKNSAGHYANLIGDYTDIGIGYAVGPNGYPYYTQVFGKYATPPAAVVSTATASKFVIAAYRDVLGRDPGQSEIDGWVAALQRGMSRTGVAGGFNNSVEYRKKQITLAYETVLGREPEPSGMASWLGGMSRNELTSDDPHRLFLMSDEFMDRNGGTIEGMVAAAYSDVLGRPASSGEVASWASIARAQGRAAVVNGIWFSDEAFRHTVAVNYQTLLGRSSTTADQNSWMAFARQYGMTAMRNEIMASAEYFNRAQSR